MKRDDDLFSILPSEEHRSKVEAAVAPALAALREEHHAREQELRATQSDRFLGRRSFWAWITAGSGASLAFGWMAYLFLARERFANSPLPRASLEAEDVHFSMTLDQFLEEEWKKKSTQSHHAVPENEDQALALLEDLDLWIELSEMSDEEWSV